MANALLASRLPLGRVAAGALEQRTSGECALATAWLCTDVVATGTPAAAQLAGAAVWPAVRDSLRCAAVEAQALVLLHPGTQTEDEAERSELLSGEDRVVGELVDRPGTSGPLPSRAWSDLSDSGVRMVRFTFRLRGLLLVTLAPRVPFSCSIAKTSERRSQCVAGMQVLLGLCRLVDSLWPLMARTQQAAVCESGVGVTLNAVLRRCAGSARARSEDCGTPSTNSIPIDLERTSQAVGLPAAGSVGKGDARAGSVEVALRAQLVQLLKRTCEQAPD